MRASSGRLDGRHDGVDNGLHRYPLRHCFEAKDDPVPQHSVGKGLDVLGYHVVTAIEERCVANLPAQYKCNQQRDVCQYGERQKNSFHGKVSVTEGRPAVSEATSSFKE